MSVTIQEDDSQGKVATDVANGDDLFGDTVMKEWEKGECHADKNNNNKKCQQEEIIPVAGCSSWSISSPFTMSKPSTTSEGLSHPPLPTGELSLGVPAPEVDVIEDKVFKSFESLEEMEQFTKAEEANKKMRQQVEEIIRRQRRRSNATKAKSRTVVSKTSLDLPLPPIPSEASGSASSVFASNLLDEYLSKTKKELKSNYPKPTLVGCPPEGSKIYDTGILAKESVKKGGKVSSVLPFGDLPHLKKTQQPKSPLHEVTDNHFNHPLDYQSKSSVTQKSGIKTSLFSGKRAPFKSSSNPSLPLVKRKKIIMGNRNRTVVRSAPMAGDKFKQKQMIEVPDNLNISPYLKDASFTRQNEQSWQDWKRRSLISHDISFEMDLGYVNFALDVLVEKETGLSNSQKRGKRKKGYVYEDEYDFLGPSTSKKSSDRGASEEIALASMISRHSKRDIKLPSRYHDSGLMVGGQWIIPGPTIETTSTISPAKTNEAKSEKKARKTLLQEQERLRKTKTYTISITEPPPPPSGPARAIKEKKKREKRPCPKLEAPSRNKNKIGNVQTQVVNRDGVRWKITTPIPHGSEDGGNPSKTSQLRQFRHPSSAPPVPNVTIRQFTVADQNRTRNELSAIQTTFSTNSSAFLTAFPAQLPQKPPLRGRPSKIKIGKVGRPILPPNMIGRVILPKTSELDTKMVPLSQVSFGFPFPSEQQQTNCNSSTSPRLPAVIWNNQHLQVHQLPPRPSPALLNHQMQQQQWAAQQESVCDRGLESESGQQQHEPSVFGKEIYELKELYRNLFFINRPERRPYYQKMGMKPRVNKQLALEEAIDVIEKEEKKLRQLQYAHKLSILWQRKLHLCKKVITGETKIPDASLKDIMESVEKVLKTYQDSVYVTKICPHLDRTSPPSSRHSSISEGQVSSEIASLTGEGEAGETTTSLPQMPKLIPATSINGGTAIKPSSTDATIPKIIMRPHEVQISSLPPPPPLMVNGHHSGGGDSKVVEIVRPLITKAVTVTPNDNEVLPVNKKKILMKKGTLSLLMPRSMSVEEIRIPHVNGDGGGDESITVDHNDPNDLAGSFRPLSLAITANRFTYSNIRIKGGKIVSQRPSC